MLNVPDEHVREELHVDVNVFEKMKKLKLLKLSGIRPCEQFTYLSNELCYLDWDDYPTKFLPSNFHPKNLVELRLCHNQIKEISSSIKFLQKLKYLDFGDSLYLYKIPDLSSLSYLEELNLEGCKNLIEVHESIGVHERLVCLEMGDCKNLRSLAKSIKLEKLKYLNLSGCLKLEKFPEIQGCMDRLWELYLTKTATKDLPSSIELLEGLQDLLVGDCRKLKRVPSNIFSRMKDLKSLAIGGTAIEHGSNLSSIPTSLIQLKCLKSLDLEHCTSLRTLTSLPSSIKKVNAHGCKSLERYWIPPSAIGLNNRELRFSECHKLVMDEMGNMPNISSQSQLQGVEWIIFRGSEIRQWFRHKSEVEGSSLYLVVDHLSSYNNVKGIAICAVSDFHGMEEYFGFDLKINGYGVKTRLRYEGYKGSHASAVTIVYEHSVGQIMMEERKVKKMGIHLIMEEQGEGEG
ncbi:disease resistance protein LAZ5-like [Cornus florida]|uniref:disease resistance protein LAZ5-like n=1 Tax=Cornus florida TaxID=4283 RepID=UPI0028A14473|nr:disease resistance protein LAZ5-like [Cornus florida]